MKNTIVNGFTWDAASALQNARKSAKRGDVYFVAGCLTRIVSDVVQTLYALNETYFISDKRLSQVLERFGIKPENFAERIGGMLGNMECDKKRLEETLLAAETLLNDVIVFCGDSYIAKY